MSNIISSQHLKKGVILVMNISILPYKDRPYEWARREMDTFFPNPDKFWITELEKMSVPPNVHISIFHDPKGKVDIWRVYWSDIDSVKYNILLNYSELKARWPSIVALLESNGVAAYEMEIGRKQKFESTTRHKINYAPLQPFKV